MEENARKRKREEDGDVSEYDGVETEKPKEGLKDLRKIVKKQKKEKAEPGKQAPNGGSNSLEGPKEIADATAMKAARRKEKRECKLRRKETDLVKTQAKKARKGQDSLHINGVVTDVEMAQSDDLEEKNDALLPHVESIDVAGLVGNDADQADEPSTAVPSPTPPPIFDIPNAASGTSSISSIAPLAQIPSETPQGLPSKETTKPKVTPEEAQARFRRRLEELRAARKADTIDGTPARNRQELMEARRKKEEQRRAQKKELRQKAREEERLQRDIALSRGSPLLSPGIMSPASGSNTVPSPLGPQAEPINNFSFGRIAFENGQTMTANLNAVIDAHKAKGPQDPHTALEAATKCAARLSALDPTKRADIEEKNVWLNARKRAHGERIRDDSSLLKKTLKRKEKSKKKSEKEWGERIEGVEKGKAIRQKKREENLQKRREEKGSKGKKKSKAVKKARPKARPGFEGSFRAKAGGGGSAGKKK